MIFLTLVGTIFEVVGYVCRSLSSQVTYPLHPGEVQTAQTGTSESAVNAALKDLKKPHLSVRKKQQTTTHRSRACRKYAQACNAVVTTSWVLLRLSRKSVNQT